MPSPFPTLFRSYAYICFHTLSFHTLIHSHTPSHTLTSPFPLFLSFLILHTCTHQHTYTLSHTLMHTCTHLHTHMSDPSLMHSLFLTLFPLPIAHSRTPAPSHTHTHFHPYIHTHTYFLSLLLKSSLSRTHLHVLSHTHTSLCIHTHPCILTFAHSRRFAHITLTYTLFLLPSRHLTHPLLHSCMHMSQHFSLFSPFFALPLSRNSCLPIYLVLWLGACILMCVYNDHKIAGSKK
ncbi:hypothetical protein KP509_08G014500 [Ceratopteris richardii]|uniref:Uncharacterized protein n=1 Tax=Ceratopteris richardii TaxID=49495 RepID=A0A8T2U8B6_CERRI|nr:hypothetical protein KP509_08G014500 [Ceratopteris richardii]